MRLNDMKSGIAERVFGRRDPDARGYYGAYGGRFVPETLVPALEDLQTELARAKRDPAFKAELKRLLATFAG